MLADPDPVPEPCRSTDEPEVDEVDDREWRVAAAVDSRLEADLVVHLLTEHGVVARAVVHPDGTADIVVPETASDAARRALNSV